MSRYPTLELIDGLRPDQSTLASSPNAAALEPEARRLISAYWSDNVWFSGHVSTASLAAVTTRLDPMA